MTTEQKEFEAGFHGEEIEKNVTEQDQSEELTSEAESHEEEVNQEETSDPATELTGLSKEALEILEKRMTSAVETKLSGRLRNLEGNLGGIKQKLDMMATAKAAAKESGADVPTASQIKEASTDGEKMKLLREDFPEFAEAMDERLQELGRNDELVSKLQAAEGQLSSTAEELFKIQQIRYLDKRHPDWEDVIKTDGYINWLHNQPEDVRRKAELSNRAEDAISILDQYKKTAGQNRTTSQRRLEDAVMPTSGGVDSTRHRKTELEEFEAAFKAAR